MALSKLAGMETSATFAFSSNLKCGLAVQEVEQIKIKKINSVWFRVHQPGQSCVMGRVGRQTNDRGKERSGAWLGNVQGVAKYGRY